MTRFSRLRSVLVAAAAIAVLALGAVAAQAARVHYAGGTTSVTPSAAAAKALSDAGVSVSPVAPATAGGGAFTFPIARGFVNPTTGRAELVHRGGLKFTKSGKSVTLRRFVIHKPAGKAAGTLLARVPRRTCRAVIRYTRRHGERRAHRRAVRVCRRQQRWFVAARVTNASAAKDGTTVSGTLRITKATAAVFNKVAGKKVAKAGDVLGTGTSTVGQG